MTGRGQAFPSSRGAGAGSPGRRGLLPGAGERGACAGAVAAGVAGLRSPRPGAAVGTGVAAGAGAGGRRGASGGGGRSGSGAPNALGAVS